MAKACGNIKDQEATWSNTVSARNSAVGIALQCAQGHLDHILSKDEGLGGITVSSLLWKD